MTKAQQAVVNELLRAMANNAGFAVQNAELGNEKAVIKYQAQSQEAHEAILRYLESITNE